MFLVKFSFSEKALVQLVNIYKGCYRSHDLLTCKGHDTVVSLSAGDDMRPAEAK